MGHETRGAIHTQTEPLALRESSGGDGSQQNCAIHEVMIPASQPCLQCVLENISGMKVRSTRQIIEQS